MTLQYRLFVDESGFSFPSASTEEIESSLDQFLTTLDSTKIHVDELCKWSQIWYIQSADRKELLILLNQKDGIDRDISRRVLRTLERIPDWDETIDSNDLSLGVKCDMNEIEIAPSIAACSALMSERHVTACITTSQTNRSGSVTVHCQNMNPINLRFISTARDGNEYWRDVAKTESRNSDCLGNWSTKAFPRLIFAEGIWSQVKNFEGKFKDILPKLIGHLSGLNDHAENIWEENVEPAQIQARMRSIAGIDCSPDSPKTHKNRSAMTSRIVHFSTKELVCEWHTKLEPNRNRIHFCINEGQVYVGKFTKHLAT
ncbi:MAG: hypothetical protein K0Q46_2066 [Rhodococcus erythropolis]|jgi:hypothetical protein|nr:hypothetical protein [Rhodococcus erythropolis]MDF2895280.1 hypothetical protein [Rhodococcus erythropolis]